MAESEGAVGAEDLPIAFQVKYLGQHDAGGLWGIKHTRKPVDAMVSAAKALPAGRILPAVKLVVSTEGVRVDEVGAGKRDAARARDFAIESVSYGVQDLIYTRVFSMIVVRESDSAGRTDRNPFECHAFVCDSKNSARKLTYALAAAFQEYSERVKKSQADAVAGGSGDASAPTSIRKKFAIDLRSAEELQADMDAETEA